MDKARQLLSTTLLDALQEEDPETFALVSRVEPEIVHIRYDELETVIRAMVALYDSLPGNEPTPQAPEPPKPSVDDFKAHYLAQEKARKSRT